MRPQGPFCAAGAPVVDERGNLVAMGAPRDPKDGGFLTRLIDVRAVRAVLAARSSIPDCSRCVDDETR
jgi:hypothetical protein